MPWVPGPVLAEYLALSADLREGRVVRVEHVGEPSPSRAQSASTYAGLTVTTPKATKASVTSPVIVAPSKPFLSEQVREACEMYADSPRERAANFAQAEKMKGEGLTDVETCYRLQMGLVP